MVRLGVFLVCVCLCTSATAQTLQQGYAALNNRDDETAFSIFSTLANQGDAEAQTVLAWQYLNGRGTGEPSNPEAAVRLYTRAARGGNATAMYNLATLKLQGRGTDQDFVRATELYEEAGDAGFHRGYHQAGLSHETGRGMVVNPFAAFALYAKGFDAKDPRSTLRYADFLVLGEHVDQNLGRAMRIYQGLAKRRAEENIRVPDPAPRIAEVEALLAGGPFNSEIFRVPAYSPPGPGETMADASKRMSDLAASRRAGRAAQIASEKADAIRAAAPETDISCSPQAPAEGAIVQANSPGSAWSVRRSASRGASTAIFLPHLSGLRINTLMERGTAQTLDAALQGPLGRIILRDGTGTALGPGWAVEAKSFHTTLNVQSNITLDDKCNFRVKDHMPEAQCLSEAKESWFAVTRAFANAPQEITFEYWPNPGKMGYSQSLELMAPAVYDLAEQLVGQAKMRGTFPILQCSAAK